MKRVFEWFEREGSTRPAALLRVGLAVLIWARFGRDVSLHMSRSWFGVYFGVTFFAATTLMLLGLRARLATAFTAVLLAWIYYVAGISGGLLEWTHHHVYLLFVATLLLAFADCGASLSIDRWRAIRRTGKGPKERGSQVALRLISIQVVAVYLWGAIDKTNGSWLGGERMEQIAEWQFHGRAVYELLSSPPVAAALAIAVVAIEYFLVVGLLVRRLRPAALLVGCALHGGLYLLLPVQTFSATMILLYLSFLDPDAVHRTIDRLVASDA